MYDGIIILSSITSYKLLLQLWFITLYVLIVVILTLVLAVHMQKLLRVTLKNWEWPGDEANVLARNR